MGTVFFRCIAVCAWIRRIRQIAVLTAAVSCASDSLPPPRPAAPPNATAVRGRSIADIEDRDGEPPLSPPPVEAAEEAPAPAQHYPFQDAVNPVGGKRAPAARYAALMPAACRAELRRRKLPFKSAGGPSSGITTPLRFDGSLSGVRFVTPGRKSVYGKLDCRLALVLDDLARVLAEHGVIEVHVDNLYRPHAHLPGKRKPSQHSYGLAIDIVRLAMADGRTLVVEDDWRGAIGDAPCGPQSLPRNATENTVDLRTVVCDVARAGLFHHMLTPNFDAAHENHLHFDIKRGDVRLVVE